MNAICFDILVVICLFAAAVYGSSQGFVLTLGRLCITVLSFAAGYGLASLYGAQAAAWLEALFLSESPALARMLGNVLLFLVGFLVFRALGRWLLRLVNRLTGLPVLHFLNRVGGALCGLFEGGLLLLIIGQLLIIGDLFPESVLEQTVIAKYFLRGFL